MRWEQAKYTLCAQIFGCKGMRQRQKMLSISECDDFFFNPQWGNRVTRCPELSRLARIFCS